MGWANSSCMERANVQPRTFLGNPWLNTRAQCCSNDSSAVLVSCRYGCPGWLCIPSDITHAGVQVHPATPSSCPDKLTSGER